MVNLAQLVTLSNKHGMQVTFMDIGATWLSCILPVKGNQREVLLGVDSMENFQKQASYLGANGRYANRIANGRFKVDGTGYKLDANQSGNTTMVAHGFDKRRWQLTTQTPMSVVYSFRKLRWWRIQGFRVAECVCELRVNRRQPIVYWVLCDNR